ncbi:MAG: hypothetical protein CMP58_03495 [Flavobacteriales bacterium]|nr:hypothetical protein [Flavobacteriales bacterium]
MDAELVAADAGVDLVSIHRRRHDVAWLHDAVGEHLACVVADVDLARHLAAATVPHELAGRHLHAVTCQGAGHLVVLRPDRADLKHLNLLARQVLAPEDLELIVLHEVEEAVVDRRKHVRVLKEVRVLAVIDPRVREVQGVFGLLDVAWPPHRPEISIS